MSLPPTSWRTDLGAALGRLPSGLFILTARVDGCDTGILVSWVQQAGFEPPMVTVAVRRDRPIGAALAASGRFVLNQVAAGHKHLIRHFARSLPPGEPAFEGIALGEPRGAGPVLAEAIAVLEVEATGAIDSGDHRVFLGRVTDGVLARTDVEPFIHVRRDGFHY